MKKYMLGVSTGLMFVAIWGFWSPNTPTPPAQPHEGTYLELSTNFIQNAAEYKALCYQAYNVATRRLDNMIASIRRGVNTLPFAVVVDVDETVLDNSRYQGDLVLEGGTFPDRWVDWCNLSEAPSVPGALDFLKHAADKGCTVFYVTNRKRPELEGTIRNLKQLGFPNADSAHVLYRTDGSDKSERTARVAATHNILLFCGDNLGDFSGLFDKQTTERREFVADSMRRTFGERFIVLPNPMYGDWVGGLIEQQYGKPWLVLDSLRTSRLRGF